MGIGGLQSACLCITRGGRLTHIRLFRYALLASVAFGISACSESQTGSPAPPSAASATATSRAPQPLTAGPKEPEVANPTVAVPTPRTQIISGSGVLIGSTPTQGAVATPQGDITLSFVNADVREVLPRVLGDILHLNYAVDPKVQGTITVQTSRPIRQQDVLPVLQETLRASGLALVEANGVYRVTTSDEAAHTGTA